MQSPNSTPRHGSSSLFSSSYPGPQRRPLAWPSPPFLDDVKLRAEGRIGRVGKKWLALDRLNPDQQGICSATLSVVAYSTPPEAPSSCRSTGQTLWESLPSPPEN